ncbi:MAG: Lipopolysaccharide ABC transporter, ATP-binding protein LptB, partial [uncultured Gemmatimonadetes bacterium]
ARPAGSAGGGSAPHGCIYPDRTARAGGARRRGAGRGTRRVVDADARGVPALVRPRPRPHGGARGARLLLRRRDGALPGGAGGDPAARGRGDRAAGLRRRAAGGGEVGGAAPDALGDPGDRRRARAGAGPGGLPHRPHPGAPGRRVHPGAGRDGVRRCHRGRGARRPGHLRGRARRRGDAGAPRGHSRRADAAGQRAGEVVPQAARGQRGGRPRDAGRDRGAAGAQRGGEDYLVLHDGGPHLARPGRGVHRRPEAHGRAHVQAGARGDRLPGAGALHLPQADGGGERPRHPADAGHPPGGAAAPAGAAAGRAQHQARAQELRVLALRWRAAAAGDHPGAGGRPQVHAAGRALRRGGPHRGARHPADRGRPAPPRHRSADLRPQRGADAGHRGPRLHHVRRAGARVRHGERAGVERRGGGPVPGPHPRRPHAGAVPQSVRPRQRAAGVLRRPRAAVV